MADAPEAPVEPGDESHNEVETDWRSKIRGSADGYIEGDLL